MGKKMIEKLGEEMDRSQTFNPLLNTLRENDKNNLFQTNVTTAFFKTGFHLFDHYFGSVMNVHNELGEIVKQVPRLGQAAGTVNLIVGNTGTGKSTLVAQIAANIIRPYPQANVIHFDCEQRTDLSRIENITGLSIKDFRSGRYILRSSLVGIDVIQEMIVKLSAAKMQNKEELMIRDTFKDEFDQPIDVLQPTIIIIDSIASVMNETLSLENAKEIAEAQQLQSNTEGARSAKTIKGFLKEMLPLCKTANIIVYIINHINQQMTTNAFIPMAKQQNYLKQDESIPGGRGLLYFPYNIIKLIAKPNDDFTIENDGFNGHMILVEPIKSSSNQSGNNSKGLSFEMVFSKERGFDSLRTLLLYARDRGIVDGNRTRMKFKEDQSFTFSMKDLEKEKDEKPIWECTKKYILPLLEIHLPYVEYVKFDPRMMEY